MTLAYQAMSRASRQPAKSEITPEEAQSPGVNKYDAALTALHNCHADKSMTLETCLENLQGLRDELDALIDATRVDLSQRESL